MRASDHAAAVIGAVDVAARVLAGALGWSTFDVPALPSGRLEQNLIQTGMIGESYQVASHWDWMMRRFRVGGEASGPVTLTRLVHPGGRDHDLYLVMGKRNRTFTSRQSAILEAHAQAGVPMFEYIDSQIRRVTFEGAPPIEIARALRNRVLLNGGICAHGWIYQVGVGNEVWLAKLLPGLISGVTVISGEETDDATRRGRGARRAMWINGSIAA